MWVHGRDWRQVSGRSGCQPGHSRMLTHQQNSPPAATSKTSPEWCCITNRDKKEKTKETKVAEFESTELYMRVCGYDDKRGAEKRRNKMKGGELPTDYDP